MTRFSQLLVQKNSERVYKHPISYIDRYSERIHECHSLARASGSWNVNLLIKRLRMDLYGLCGLDVLFWGLGKVRMEIGK